MNNTNLSSWRQRHISGPMLRRLRTLLPPMSDTEREALAAGDVWWDAQLLSGKPDWRELLKQPAPGLTEEEQAFLDGPVVELCRMIDDWEIFFTQRQIPETIWQFLREHGFFGIIIPKRYGGLGFSAYAHSEIVTRLSTASIAVAVTVMVPNSLGPGELLLEFGTDEQRDYYLPRLADGREIPCFGLTSPEAGSDAAAMLDRGVVCQGEYRGEQTLGIRLNWHKRYITLGPVATLLGLAFKLYDPEGLLGGPEELGITVALVPTDTPGVEIGDCHYPALQAFQNGPNWGKDVFLPLDAIIGGRERIGQGWRMLMTALAAGRSISLPSLSVGGAMLAAYTTGAYARIRQQFGIPIGKFEGVQGPLAEIAATAYLLDAARRTTTAAIDHGHKPAVLSAILKYHATERLRTVVNHAMDIHGGKAICDGPANYLGNVYRAIPVAITVEGANILTRSLIIFGQGAIRCHPFLLAEMQAAEQADSEEAVQRFDQLLVKHVCFQLKNLARATWHNWTCGLFAAAPRDLGKQRRHYRQLSRYSATLALVAEVALVTLGGGLKRRELISARIGDMLSELYLLSCALKRFEDDGCPVEDEVLLDWCMQDGLNKLRQRLAEVLDNFPSRLVAWLLRVLVMPFGPGHRPASDKLTRACAELLLQDTSSRRRLTTAVFTEGEAIAKVKHAFEEVLETEPLRDKLKREGLNSARDGLARGTLDAVAAARLEAVAAAVAEAVAVDHFPVEALRPQQQSKESSHET